MSDPPATETPSVAHALSLHQRGQLKEALVEITALLAADPAVAGGHNLHGLILAGLGDATGAVAAYGRALAEAPADPNALTNRGSTLMQLGRHEEAMADLRAAVAADPASVTAHFNLGRAYSMQSDNDRAVACYDQVLALEPGNAKALWAKGVAQLAGGDFAGGWKNYNARWRAPGFGNGAPRDFGKPRYTGAETLAGRTLFVHAEQGFGDTIQFCRYIAPVAAMGAKVLFMVQTELRDLLQTSALRCTFFVPGVQMPRFDYDIPLLNLPAALGTTIDTIPAQVPYLAAPLAKAERWRQLLGPHTRPRIGVAWSGRRSHVDDDLRSIPIAQFAPLFEAGAEIHVLQTDVTDAERAYLSGKARIFDVPDRDFGDAAAHIAAMDHVISVDTSLAHLAGALAKPVSILLPFAPDFRWMLGRTDSPWYPTARLIRQNRIRDWSDVIAQAAAQIKAVVARLTL